MPEFWTLNPTWRVEPQLGHREAEGDGLAHGRTAEASVAGGWGPGGLAGDWAVPRGPAGPSESRPPRLPSRDQ